MKITASAEKRIRSLDLFMHVSFSCLLLNFLNWFRSSIADTQWLPLFIVFEAVLNSMSVMGFIKAFWFYEHLLAFEQAMDAGLTGFRTFLTFEFCRVTRHVIGGFLVGSDIAFKVAQDHLVIRHAQQIVRRHRDLAAAAWRIDNVLGNSVTRGVTAQAFHDLNAF